jgi:LCP family protein required for cell wall assembly
MPEGSTDDARRRSRRSTPHAGGVANSHRLAALGAAIDEKAGVKHKNRVPRQARTGWRRHRGWWITAVSVAAALALILGGGYIYAYYQLSHIKRVNVAGEVKRIGNQPFNILEIGSDSRAGLTGWLANQTGATSGATGYQHSDVVKILHVDPSKGTISVLSIPRDTMTTLLANQGTNGRFNRINVNFGNGPSLLAQTITANFGIPIAHTVVVSFLGVINATNAIGGVHMFFPYPARDTMSALNITHPGCQLITNLTALELVRSRHYEWYEHGQWNSDVTSDYGRIYRQNEFLKAMIDKAKTVYNPLTLASFVSKLTAGLAVDSNFSAGEMIGLAEKFHNLNVANLQTDTLPTAPGSYGGLGSILFVQEPAMQQMLFKIFGSQLLKPTNPPPVDSAGNTPSWTVPAATPAKVASSVKIPAGHYLVNLASSSSTAPTTTTTLPEGDQWFDPYPC